MLMQLTYGGRAAWNCCDKSAQLSQNEAEYIARSELGLMSPQEQKSFVRRRSNNSSSNLDDFIESAWEMAPEAAREYHYSEELRTLKHGLEELLGEKEEQHASRFYQPGSVEPKRRMKPRVSLEELVNETADNIGYLRGPSTHKQRRGRGIE